MEEMYQNRRLQKIKEGFRKYNDAFDALESFIEPGGELLSDAVFPKEVWDIILKNITSPADIKSCSMTCRSFKALLEGRYYSEVLMPSACLTAMMHTGNSNLQQMARLRKVCKAMKDKIDCAYKSTAEENGILFASTMTVDLGSEIARRKLDLLIANFKPSTPNHGKSFFVRSLSVLVSVGSQNEWPQIVEGFEKLEKLLDYIGEQILAVKIELRGNFNRHCIEKISDILYETTNIMHLKWDMSEPDYATSEENRAAGIDFSNGFSSAIIPITEKLETLEIVHRGHISTSAVIQACIQGNPQISKLTIDIKSRKHVYLLPVDAIRGLSSVLEFKITSMDALATLPSHLELMICTDWPLTTLHLTGVTKENLPLPGRLLNHFPTMINLCLIIFPDSNADMLQIEEPLNLLYLKKFTVYYGMSSTPFHLSIDYIMPMRKLTDLQVQTKLPINSLTYDPAEKIQFRAGHINPGTNMWKCFPFLRNIIIKEGSGNTQRTMRYNPPSIL